jgi:SAM-dependent methyltransferase
MTEWPLKRIQVGRRFRKALGDLRALAESIDEVGLLHPVVVTPQGRLIAGRRRLEAVKLLGWRTVPVHVVDLENIIEGELAENVHRKDFLPSELWAIAQKVKEIVRTPVGRRSEKVENCHHCNGKTRDKAAAYFGFSGRHLEKIGAVCESEFPELARELDAEPRSVHRCYQKLKLLRNQQAALDEEIEPVQVGRYRLRQNEIICGDCRELLPRIKDRTYHAVITDPAYGIGQVYNGRKETADDPVSYWRWFRPIYRELLRVLKPGGFCAIFQGGRYLRHFWDWFGDQDFIVYAACREPLAAFKGGQPITCCWEPVVLFYKGRPIYRSADFLRSRNWFVSNSSFDDLAKFHPCPEPLDQCEELIRSFTCEGALVLDPLCGVGTIPIAAARYGRRYLGIDLEPEYVRIAQKRMKLLGRPGHASS